MSHLQTIYEERFTPDFWQIPEDDTVLKLMSALRERSYPGIYAALRKLKEPLSGDNAASCLVNALSCTIRAFAAVLGRRPAEPGPVRPFHRNSALIDLRACALNKTSLRKQATPRTSAAGRARRAR